MSKKLIVLIGIVALGFVLRSYKLTQSPEGLYIDEVSIGYNAYSIVETGKDEHGKMLPVFFEAFGEYKLPVYIYSVAAVQFFTGPTDASIRIPAVLFGTGSIFLIYFLSQKLVSGSKNKMVKMIMPALSAFLLALSPWHFQFTHAGFEASAAVFFLLVGLCSFFIWMEKRQLSWLLLSVVGLCITLYSYNSARVVVPLTVMTLVIWYWKECNKKQLLFGLVSALVILIPFITFSFSADGLRRAQQVSIFYQKGTDKAREFFHQYLENISPSYLFFSGDPTIGSGTKQRMGLIHLIEFPFLLFGFLFILLRGDKASRIVIPLFLIATIPAALANPSPHALRNLLSVPFITIISAWGVVAYLSRIKNRTLMQIFLSFYCICISVSFAYFMYTYHTKYLNSTGWDWEVGSKRVFDFTEKVKQDYPMIFVDPGIYPEAILWYSRFNPSLYQAQKNQDRIGVYIPNSTHEQWEKIIDGTSALVVSSPDKVTGGVLETIFYPDGKKAFVIWRL